MVALPSKRGGVKANGECSVRVNPVKGVCVMKVTAVDGNVVTFKTIF